MDTVECMRRFLAVAETGGFSQAACQMDLPKSAVSSSVTKLETRLQTRLFHRSTRQVTLTESGRQYLPECQRILADLDAVESQLQDDAGQLTGDIVVDMPGRLYASVVAPKLTEWFRLHPKTRIRLLGADYRIDPVKESVDCVIRAGTLKDSDLIARPLGNFVMVNCVSPAYLKAYGHPASPADLSNHFVVGYSPDMRPAADSFDYFHNGHNYQVAMTSRVSVATTDAYLTSCLAGLGIIQVPHHGVKHYLASGELVTILDNFTCPPMPLSVVYTSRRHMPKRISAFINWLTEQFA